METVDRFARSLGGEARDVHRVSGHSEMIGSANVPVPLAHEGPKPFDFGELDVTWEDRSGILWAFMTPSDRPNYSMALLRDSLRCLDGVRERFGQPGSRLRYMVVGSHFPGVFNLGGDLEHFAEWAAAGDRDNLLAYGYLCVALIHRVWTSNQLPLINIALVQGDAFGGGLESVLAFDVVVAERQARFCLPEIKFGLFPGMGASSLLSRKLGQIQAEKMMRSGKTYTAEELYDMGLVTVLADEGQGASAVRSYVASIGARHAGHLGVFEAGRKVAPLPLSELQDIVELWADTVLSLPATSVRMMQRLAQAQSRITTNVALNPALAAGLGD